MSTTRIHASCVVIGEAGVLIRGPSGAGKSSMARRLIDAARARGWFARLVADDRVLLDRTNGRLLARPHEAVQGLIEIRGLGLAAAPFEGGAVLRLLVDLSKTDPPRLPQDEDTEAELGGIVLPRVVCRPDDDDRVLGSLGLGSWSTGPKR